jgi:UDP-N-acetyl-D-mannosaminuronate dehydrogenase
MKQRDTIVVAGLGEVGTPLFELSSQFHNTIGVDITPPQHIPEKVDVLHICYPFRIADFIGETARYIDLFKPALTIINSTIDVGTTRAVAHRTGAAVVNSPVRGKHARMLDDLRAYVKFIGALNPESGQKAADHFQSFGMKTKVLSSAEATELAKLTETTYFGLLIAWAQEVERHCDRFDQHYDEVASFWEEIKYLPPVTYFPGIIGGHCVMPNIEILSQSDHSTILKAIQDSNQKKIERESQKQRKHSSIADKQLSGKKALLASSSV